MHLHRAVEPVDESLLAEAVDITRRAGTFTLDHFRSTSLTVQRKSDGTEVTDADRGAERIIRTYLQEKYPDDSILGEEEGRVEGTSGRRWYIDPIDGTKAFVHGVPLYTNLLAVYDAAGPAIAVVNMPALGETVFAGRGLGCYVNGDPTSVSDERDISRAYLTTSGFDYWPDSMLDGVRAAGFQLRTWGDGYGYALVATGRAEAMVDPIAATWDLAPMPLLIAEAGGRFSDVSGTEAIDSGSGVASNGHIHDDVLAALDPTQT